MEALLSTLLRVRGIKTATAYSKPDESQLSIESHAHQLSEAIHWAEAQGYAFGITGSVEEWLYKTGVEREPAVGVTLRVVDIHTGKTLWAVSGARSGWGREAVSGNAQKLLTKMLSKMQLEET